MAEANLYSQKPFAPFVSIWNSLKRVGWALKWIGVQQNAINTKEKMQRRTFYTEILQYKLTQCLQCNAKQCKVRGWQQRMPTLPSFWRKKTVLREICWPARLPQLPNTISHVHGKRGRVQWNMWQSMLLPLPPLPPRFQEGIWGLRSGFWINRRKFTMQVSRHKQLSFGRNTFVNFPQLKW